MLLFFGCASLDYNSKFNFTVSANISTYKNEVTSLGNGDTIGYEIPRMMLYNIATDAFGKRRFGRW